MDIYGPVILWIHIGTYILTSYMKGLKNFVEFVIGLRVHEMGYAEEEDTVLLTFWEEGMYMMELRNHLK